ncbi:MAG: hypothetical protein IPK58_12345 [Acidobacteria bacterium]|nr:hypothetical protein [Acidobacteriota bacterium]
MFTEKGSTLDGRVLRVSNPYHAGETKKWTTIRSSLRIMAVIPIILLTQTSCTIPQESSKQSNRNAPSLNTNGALIDGAVDSELGKNLRIWRENPISDYVMTLYLEQPGIYQPVSPVRVDVTNGNAVSVKALDDSRVAHFPDYESYNTVEKLFVLIQDGYDRDFRVRARYDEKLGVPIEINISNPRTTTAYTDIKIENFAARN